MHALIIDDSRTLRKLLGQMLHELGFEVTEAENGRAGIDCLAMQQPDVILVDWNMPVMNGLEFVEQVRAGESHRDTPIMMVTTENDFAHISQAIAAGANEYVMKPFGKEMLADKLRILSLL